MLHFILHFLNTMYNPFFVVFVNIRKNKLCVKISFCVTRRFSVFKRSKTTKKLLYMVSKKIKFPTKFERFMHRKGNVRVFKSLDLNQYSSNQLPV